MSIFDFQEEPLGNVISVDTGTVVVFVGDLERLRRLQVNQLAVLRSSRPGQHLIGMVQKIQRSIDVAAGRRATGGAEEDDGGEFPAELNVVRVSLLGTFLDRDGARSNVFRRTLESVPEIDAPCFALHGEALTNFMRAVAQAGGGTQRLALGHYAIDANAEAFLNGNRLFQRHAVIVGSTGSGKSWATARLLEQVAALSNANAVVFDVHGEYSCFAGDGFRCLRIAGPGDIETGASLADGVIHLPYWLLGYEALVEMLVDRSDSNAPNQAMVMSSAIVDAKRAVLQTTNSDDILANFTVDSPVPFRIGEVLEQLRAKNTEMVDGVRGQKAGDFNGRLPRLIARLEAKVSDRRLGFMFGAPDVTLGLGWLEELVALLFAGRREQGGPDHGGVKVIDFSEVPSDVLPLMVSLLARMAFYVQQWTPSADRHPIALFCDEAHLYVPANTTADGAGDISVGVFERIAKEGRKYGVGLVVISQRPSEVNRTVLSQCSNVIAMRLTNADDQAVVRRLLPDSLGDFASLLPVLDTGEALVVGDASLLPTRVRVAEPSRKPNSGTVDFWDEWATGAHGATHAEAVRAWRRQSMKAKLA